MGLWLVVGLVRRGCVKSIGVMQGGLQPGQASIPHNKAEEDVQ